MAINHGLSTGTFKQLNVTHETSCKDYTTSYGSRFVHFYDFRFRKEDPSVIVKWLRRNLGERGSGYDFALNHRSGTVQVEIWNSKLNFIYEMWIK
jgi:hypothetical protein